MAGKAFTIFTSKDEPIQKDVQLLFIVTPGPDPRPTKSFAPVAWEVVTFKAREFTEKTITWHPGRRVSLMSGDRVMQDRASIEVDPGTYVELGGRNQFFTHPFWDDESNKIIAINNTNEEQQFALGTLVKNGPYHSEFQPFGCLRKLKKKEGLATDVPGYIQAYSVVRYSRHQRIAEDLSRRETLLLVGFNVPSLKILDMPEHTYWCLKMMPDGKVKIESDRNRGTPLPEPLKPAETKPEPEPVKADDDKKDPALKPQETTPVAPKPTPTSPVLPPSPPMSPPIPHPPERRPSTPTPVTKPPPPPLPPKPIAQEPVPPKGKDPESKQEPSQPAPKKEDKGEPDVSPTRKPTSPDSSESEESDSEDDIGSVGRGIISSGSDDEEDTGSDDDDLAPGPTLPPLSTPPAQPPVTSPLQPPVTPSVQPPVAPPVPPSGPIVSPAGPPVGTPAGPPQLQPATPAPVAGTPPPPLKPEVVDLRPLRDALLYAASLIDKQIPFENVPWGKQVLAQFAPEIMPLLNDFRRDAPVWPGYRKV